MPFKWFGSAEATELATSLADGFLAQVARASSPARQRKAKLERQGRQYRSAVHKVLERVDREARPLQLNLFKRAKMANTFKWKLLENGIEREVADELTQALLLRLSANESVAVQPPPDVPRSASRHNAADREALLAKADKLLSAGHYDEAVNSYQSLLNVEPDHVIARNNLGSAFYKQGRYLDAEAQFRVAIAKKANYADALSNLSSGGVTGGALVIIGEDYGEGSSIMQERSHAYALKSQIWLLDPRPNLPTLVRMVEEGFALSEASNTPVMLEVRIRTCHVHGQFVAKNNEKPKFSLREALENPVRDVNRIVLPPASFLHEKEKLERRGPAAIEFIKSHKLNEIFGPANGDVGIVMLGGMYNTTMRALQYLGLADGYGESALPLYVLNVAYPLIEDELLAFCAGKRAVLMIEEGAPDYI